MDDCRGVLSLAYIQAASPATGGRTEVTFNLLVIKCYSGRLIPNFAGKIRQTSPYVLI